MDREIYKILLLMKRRPGMSVEDFRAYYEDRHAPFLLAYASPARLQEDGPHERRVLSRGGASLPTGILSAQRHGAHRSANR